MADLVARCGAAPRWLDLQAEVEGSAEAKMDGVGHNEVSSYEAKKNIIIIKIYTYKAL